MRLKDGGFKPRAHYSAKACPGTMKLFLSLHKVRKSNCVVIQKHYPQLIMGHLPEKKYKFQEKNS